MPDVASQRVNALIEDLSFRYPRREVLRDVSFQLGDGATGLLGPNGAGKSTLMSLLATVARPQKGSITLFGHDLGSRRGIEAARPEFGYLPQRFSMPQGMRVIDVVAYSAWCHGVARAKAYLAAERALESVMAAPFARRRTRALSGGERQRVGIAAAIAHGPLLLLLDEPTAGLDSVVRVQLRELIGGLGEERTVLMSTHLVDDVAQSCAGVLVLDQGRVVFDGATAQLESSVVEHDRRYASSLEQAYIGLLR